MSAGILAFGSIAEEPGTELAAAVTRRIEVETPFAVEFARSSRTRDGAPTLVPVREGGAHVPASVLVLDDSVTMADAREMLYRRETGRLHHISTGGGSQAAWIAELAGFAGTSACLYTAFRPNIQPLTAEKLAELAVCSAVAPAGAGRRDGISYLQQQKRRGPSRRSSPAYRSQSEAEFSFRQLKDTRVVSFSPMHHWTEHNIRVHVFTCVLALQIAHLMRRAAARAGLDLSVRALLGELAGIGETVLLYQGGRGLPRAHRMLTETSPVQDKLTEIFGLARYAPRR